MIMLSGNPSLPYANVSNLNFIPKSNDHSAMSVKLIESSTVVMDISSFNHQLQKCFASTFIEGLGVTIGASQLSVSQT